MDISFLQNVFTILAYTVIEKHNLQAKPNCMLRVKIKAGGIKIYKAA
jgi:hypothetical protein